MPQQKEANKKLVYGILIVLAIICIVAAAAWYMYRYDTHLVTAAADGTTLQLTCDPETQPIEIISASYATADDAAIDVTHELQAQISAASGASYTVSGKDLKQPAGGSLTFRYRCGAAAGKVPEKSGFTPVPVSPCAGGACADPYSGKFAPNKAGLTFWQPYSPQSAVSLARGAESPEIASQFSPMTGVGKGALVRALGDRYRGDEALARMAAFERQPGQTGHMEAVDDGAMSFMQAVTRRSAPPSMLPSNAVGKYEVDSDFITDGAYGGAVLRETFNSSRMPGGPNLLTGFKKGLGSTLIDPRFMPGPRDMLGDINQGPLTHAGSASLGYFASDAFRTNGHWASIHVRGFGNDDGYPEALVTGVSRF